MKSVTKNFTFSLFINTKCDGHGASYCKIGKISSPSNISHKK